ncbi:MAG TPA: histone deacetylase [Verrucomicrobiae bacterium]|nr:histone deacetylase [Verrucomicrobiae bacterium]
MNIVYSPRCLDYAAPGHPETPERVRAAVAQLHKEFHTWTAPEPCADVDILRVHTREMLDAVRTGTFSDADTPVFPNIFEIAKLAAGGAILAAEHALTGQPSFSLMRPPGHHAERNRIMGFCYFNNIAIAVAKNLDIRNPKPSLRDAEGPGPQFEKTVRKVAILDFDCHHGNGTEDIFRGDERVLYVSLHQSPCYPGTGTTTDANCLNYPLPPGTGPEQFLAALVDGFDRIRNFQPDLLAVSAGFDSYKDDPITHMGLEVETFRDIGRRIADFTRPPKATASGSRSLPCFAVLEGGYSREFARCVDAFVGGWERH